MTKDELIVRLTHELYDLKHKLVDIRACAETAERYIKNSGNEVDLRIALGEVLDIINLIDVTEDYYANRT